MPFDAVDRQPVSDVVFRRLRRAVLSGELSPGEALPAERDLAATFGVNRHVLREALKRLQQAGLVAIAQGGATRVLDPRLDGGLDLLPHLAEVGAEAMAAGDPTLAREVLTAGLELRRTIGAEVARSAAGRADAATRAALPGLARAYAGPDPVGADETFWSVLVDASANVAYRLALNTLVRLAAQHRLLFDVVAAAERADVAGHERLARVVVEGRADEAYEVARSLLTSPEQVPAGSGAVAVAEVHP